MEQFSNSDKLSLITFFKESNFFNHKFIPRTKLQIIELASKNIQKICLNEVNLVFKDYIDNHKSVTLFLNELEKEEKYLHFDKNFETLGQGK